MSSNQFDWYGREYPERSLVENDMYEQEYPGKYGMEQGEQLTHGPARREQMGEEISKLDENKQYLAYVSLNNIMPYEDFMTFVEQMEYESGIWCAVKCDDEMWRPENMGFYCTLMNQSTLCSWDEMAYPNLFTWHGIAPDYNAAREAIKSEIFAKEHFVSMLNYMADQETFCEMMMLDKNFGEMAEYVEENGIEVYGFVMVGQKEDFVALSGREEVYVMDIENLY